MRKPSNYMIRRRAGCFGVRTEFDRSRSIPKTRTRPAEIGLLASRQRLALFNSINNLPLGWQPECALRPACEVVVPSSASHLEKAKSLLLNRNNQVREIAFVIGFQSLTHFNRRFKNIAGQSPTEYRRPSFTESCPMLQLSPRRLYKTICAETEMPKPR